MSKESSHAPIVETIKHLFAAFGDALQMRFELFAMEFGEERKRFLTLFIAVLAAAFAFFLGFFMLNFAILLMFWDWHTILAFVLAGLYFIAALYIIFIIYRKLKTTSVPFAATVEELKNDKALFGSENE